MNANDLLLAPSRIGVAEARAYVAKHGPADHPRDVDEFIVEGERLCEDTGLDFLIFFAIAVVESTDPKSNRPFASYWWRTKKNPVGLGIHGDAADAATPSFDSGAEAAQAFAVDLAVRVFDGRIPNQLKPYAHLNFHLPEYLAARYPAGTFRRIIDLAGKRATDPQYAVEIVKRGSAILGDVPGGTKMVPETINYASLPVPVIVDLIPESQPNQNPGIPMVPKVGVWHETANSGKGAGALMHGRYLDQGAPDEYGNPQELSYHFAVDDGLIVQKIPLNRVSWNAGDSGGPGNMTGVSAECCVNIDGDLRKAQENMAALFGLLKKKGIITAVKPHQAFSGKYCPTQLLNGRGGFTLAQALARVDYYAGLAAAPTYAPPMRPHWLTPDALESRADQAIGDVRMWYCERRWTAKRDTARLQRASRGAKKIGPPIKAGESFTGYYVFANTAGWWVLTEAGTRVWMGDLDASVRFR